MTVSAQHSCWRRPISCSTSPKRRSVRRKEHQVLPDVVCGYARHAARQARPRRMPGGRGGRRGGVRRLRRGRGGAGAARPGPVAASRRPTRPSFPLPWKPGLAWIAGNLQMDGEELGLLPARHPDPRPGRRRGQRLLAEDWASSRSSSWWTRRRTARWASPMPATRSPSPATASSSLLRNADFLTTLITHLNELGYGVYQNDHEDANGQFEINWRFDDALDDGRSESRSSSSWSRRWPRSAGCARRSCPSRSPHLTGSGAHHHSRFGTPTGKDNLFLDKSDPRGLSSVALSFLGGLLAHAPRRCAP